MIPVKKIFSLSTLFILILFVANAQLDSISVSNDKVVLLNSKVLNEQRTIWIHVPANYFTTARTYPVIYLLDGEGHFGYVSPLVDFLADYDRNRIPEMIVVAIHNVDRTRDFTPIHSLVSFDGKVDSMGMAATGGGAKFLNFIQTELVPFINSNYRTQPYRILAVHSLAGLFGLYAKETSPELFQSTILMSPAIYGGNSEVLKQFKFFLQSHQNLLGKLFISLGNESTQTVDTLVKQLKTFAPKTYDWKFQQYPDENHFSVPYKSMFDALKFIYKDWFIDNYDTTKLTFEDIQVRFNKLSKEFGYTIKPTEDCVNNYGYKQLRSGNIHAAIDLFQQNIKNYPNSWNVYDSMGDAYMRKGEKKLAIENYEKSIELNPKNDDGKEALKRLKHEQ